MFFQDQLCFIEEIPSLLKLMKKKTSCCFHWSIYNIMPSDAAGKNEGNGGRKAGSGYTTVLKIKNYCAALSVCSCITWMCPDLICTQHFMPTEYRGEFNSPKSQGLTLWQHIMKVQKRAKNYSC